MSKLNSIRTVSVPSMGKLPLAGDGGSFTPSGEKRDHKAGRLPEDGGYTVSSQPAKLEVEINLQSGIDITAINAIAGENVTVRLNDGHVHLMSNAWVADPIGISNGSSKLTIMANTSEQIS
jgi:hypothetical protein